MVPVGKSLRAIDGLLVHVWMPHREQRHNEHKESDAMSSFNRLRRTTVGVVALLAIVLGVSLAGAQPASATTTTGVQATPYNNSAHPWTTDGCSVVPDWGTSATGGAWFDFNHACIHHDGCYRGHWSDRATCDRWFLNDMIASCNAIHPWWRPDSRSSCYGQANIYYTGVRTLGGSAYVAYSPYARLA